MNCLCRPSRTITVRIILLDETDFLHDVKDDISGQTLLDIVFNKLNLIETAYFGLRYLDNEQQTHWLDSSSRLSRQLCGSTNDVYELYFGVKFYAAEPNKLLEEITRYQLYLQVKQDILQGRLPISFELAAELGAFIVQSELGDYDSRRHSPGYVSEFRLAPNQTTDLEHRVSEYHRQLKGMSPSQAEQNYLDKVKWHDMYGIDLHPVLGDDSVEYFLGLTPSGIIVLKNKTTVAYYYWPRIAKVYFKGRYFMLRVCDKNNDVSTYGFETPRKSACRHLWRCCVEHHAFFRLIRVSPIQTQENQSELFTLGSKFRYSGRTEKQAVRDALSHGRTPPSFKRVPSRRQPRRSIDDIMEDRNIENKLNIMASISIPQPVQMFDSPYRSTCNLPRSLSLHKNTNYNHTAPDSPRSTHSAPWTRSQQKGLFGVGNSPHSVRSAPTRKTSNVLPNRYRSSSVESQSSNDSRSYKRHKNRSKRTSDNESELSRGSGRSHNSHRKHRRPSSKYKRNDSGSENDSIKARNYSGHKKLSNPSELIDSNAQWHQVQKKQAENKSGSYVQQASVTKSNLATKYQHVDIESHGTHTRTRKHKKNKSPSDSHSRIWSSELAKHLQFDLVDTTGMTEDQLREIPYTVVETNSAKKSAVNSLKVHRTNTKDRVDRIRGIVMPEVNCKDVNGSIRSASTISSRDYDRNLGLVRMMSSLSVGDFIAPVGSNVNPLDESNLRYSHEHTDSGLGADQDYAYSSERSSDSTKYGTNKSSGTSITSASNHHHYQQQQQNQYQQQRQQKISPNITHDSVSNNRKPPMHPSHQYYRTATAPVHNPNNRLINNVIYRNNQYNTFSQNQLNGEGYLEPRPLSCASLFGDGIKISRGTKSDIGIPSRQNTYDGSVSKYLFPNIDRSTTIPTTTPSTTISTTTATTTKTNMLPSIKSEYLISYLNNNNIRKTSSSGHILSDDVTPDCTEDFRIENKYLPSIKNPNPNENNDNNNKNKNFNNYVNPFISNSGPILYLDSNQLNTMNNKQTTTKNFNSSKCNLPANERFTDDKCSKTNNAISNTTSIITTNKTPSRSSSLELILTPIIQSCSRRMQ